MNNKIVVIGGGAAGLMAAVTARENGSKVVILERNDRIGKKILATGNGRCNFTNIYLTIDNYKGDNPKFAYSALASLDVYQTMDLFDAMGIMSTIESDGRVFPNSLQSSSVLDIFMMEIENLGIDVMTEALVKKIRKKDGAYQLDLEDGRTIEGDKIILATGGKAMPVSGSDGNGYDLIKDLGHKIVRPLPGLVQLKLADKGNLFKQIKGVKIAGRVNLYSNDQFLAQDSGDILFTDYGISGPPILQISNEALENLEDGKDVEIRVEIMDELEEGKLVEYLDLRFKNIASRSLEESLIGMVHKKLIRPLIEEIGLDPDKNVGNVSREEIVKLAQILKSWNFKVTGSQGWRHAQVTSGGVDTRDIDSATMESKKSKGLYIVGEILDITGDCGGYNLQWAWSTGYVAGLDASSK